MTTDARVTDALKPCPFCGGEASGYPSTDEGGSYQSCYIVCHACDCSPGGCYRKADEWPQAVTIWNMRSAEQPEELNLGTLRETAHVLSQYEPENEDAILVNRLRIYAVTSGSQTDEYFEDRVATELAAAARIEALTAEQPDEVERLKQHIVALKLAALRSTNDEVT